jgi:hypothetical protein
MDLSRQIIINRWKRTNTMESDYKLNKTMGKKPWERLLGGKKINRLPKGRRFKRVVGKLV